MDIPPSVESIYERLEQAQKEAHVVLTTDERPTIVEMNETTLPENCWEGRRSMDRYMNEGIWRTDGPGFRRLQDWVEVHWNPDDEKPAPSGTTATADRWGRPSETQLDAVTATRKLITSAKLYGPEQVGRYAAEFAAHGMIETHSIYLFKAPPIEAAKLLDDHCTLLPYSEALRKIKKESDPGDTHFVWPEPHADNVCALESRHFECVGPQENDYRWYTSPLLKDGPEPLTLLLGLVWGCGFRMFANWHCVPAAVVATLPYRHTTWGRSTGSCVATLRIPGYGPPVRKRPLAVTELHDLVTKYSELPEQDRFRLRRGIARLRNSTERVDEEDRVIDVGIALQILFIEDDEQDDRATLIPRRAAWHYADSENERKQTEDMLSSFYGYYSDVVHGRTSEEPSVGESERNAKLLADADNMLRACLKTMIAEGWPEDWNDVMERSALRLDPPRAGSEIPSMRSDSLSWSVEEQREIDQALEAVWKPIVEEAPIPPPNASPTTVAGLAPEFVEPYREQGIPHVVIHPARLYMAHPKWPKSEAEPLDERAKYYCEKDVERHIRQWREAATSKRLVQFEVPTDADMYHPKCRDDWPQPLLSSHEEEPNTRKAGQGTATVETAALRDSMAAADTENRQHSATEEKSAVPPLELPTSAVSGLEKEWFRLWQAFRHDVNVAINSLLHMLDGIYARHLAERRRLIQAMDASGGAVKTLEDAVRTWDNVYSFPTYPKLRVFPALTGEPLLRRTAPDGSMEQIAFKGWVYEVWDLWESHYRTQLKYETQKLPGAIRPRQQVLGDLRHIRNNLLHNGIARGGEAASCEILQWFTEGERMRVRLRHVFDFLNQMGWLDENLTVILEGQGKTSVWHTDREGEFEEPAPALISVRPLVNPEQQDPRFRYEASVVFENGVFGRAPMGPEREETEEQAKERTRKWMKMTVNEKGDLYVPDLGTVVATKLYFGCLKGEKRPAPGIW